MGNQRRENVGLFRVKQRLVQLPPRLVKNAEISVRGHHVRIELQNRVKLLYRVLVAAEGGEGDPAIQSQNRIEWIFLQSALHLLKGLSRATGGQQVIGSVKAAHQGRSRIACERQTKAPLGFFPVMFD